MYLENAHKLYSEGSHDNAIRVGETALGIFNFLNLEKEAGKIGLELLVWKYQGHCHRRLLMFLHRHGLKHIDFSQIFYNIP